MSRFSAAFVSLLIAWSSARSVAQAQAQVQVKPWFLVIVDTSGSMQTNCTNGATNAPTCTTCTGGCASTVNSCGTAHSRISDARCALKNILNSTGDAEFALMQFHHPCSATCADQGGGDSSTCDADVVVDVSASNYDLLKWVDGTCQGSCTNGGYTQEIYSYGNTPIGKSLIRAQEYFAGIGHTSPIQADTYAGCRPVGVILLTDGDENCSGSPPTAATALRTTSVPSPKGMLTLDIKTYAVGFGLTPPNTNIEAIANNGGTDAPGGYKGFYAQDEESLSAALNLIITNSQLTERCDGKDNDCDTNIDEGFAKFCDARGIRTQNPRVPSLADTSVLVDQSTQDSRVPACSNNTCPAVSGVENNTACAAPEWASSSTCSPANVLCTSPGEVCNGLDDDCDGKVDESAPANPSVPEICGDNVDNNCNGSIDEGCNGCIAQAEICNGLDDDCDTKIDEGVTRACGTDEGECSAGIETCTAGGTSMPWSGCTAVGRSTETCNGKDDDCDGVIDGITRPCGPGITVGVCHDGLETCTASVWGSCVGRVTGSAELCDNLDNDCDGATDEGSDDPRVGVDCGNGMGVCKQGKTICDHGEIKCSGAMGGSAELCDGIDNDCDGRIDEGVAQSDMMHVGQQCVVQNAMVVYGPVMVTGECRLGTTVCANGKLTCPGYLGPTRELCDTLDQDCDGNPINGVATTDPRVGAACGKSVGQCVPGQVICTAGGMLECNASDGTAETCNSLDDDCDGLIDEGLPVNPGPCETTMPTHGNVGECKIGHDACILGHLVCADEVTPTPEVCDGLDNDCDGMTDEMDPGGGRPCGSGIGTCMTGLTKCDMGHVVCLGGTAPGVEMCDGMDNDCDGAVDEDNPQGGGSCDKDSDGHVIISSCRTSTDPSNDQLPRDQPCGECHFGVVVCRDGALACLGAVGMRPELCDGLDNDCDSPCVLDQTDPAHPVRKCPADPCSLPQGNPNRVDCLGLIDEDVDATDPNIGVACVGGSGECKAGTEQCIDGMLQCVGGQQPVPELCNGKDDDCDTLVDEGFALGTPCGVQVGECQQGVLVCDPATGKAVCEGEKGKSDERCDGLDNNCDGVIDDGNPEGGADCGSEIGECKKGVQQCISGKLRCAGAQDPTPEVCDCADNDCDGKVDEDPAPGSAICPGQGQCEMCQCAQPCRDLGEFSTGCPTGKAAVTVDSKCLCVGERCNDQTCAAETLKSGSDAIVCTPGSKSVGSCVCKNNQCVSRCDGVICSDGLVCDGTSGRCQERSCLLPQFACPAGQICDIMQLGCTDDPCTGVTCEADQACRDGACIGSCATKTCGAGQRCHDGACVADKCADVTCETGVCDPTSGTCLALRGCAVSGCKSGYVCNQGTGACDPDTCLRTRCPDNQVCREGECEPRCAAPLILCGEDCINPSSSRVHCGAKADCTDANAGTVCPEDQVCSEGSCTGTCKAGQIECEGGCVDPDTDPLHCGASGMCDGVNAGIACPSGTLCKGGTCLKQTSGGTTTKHQTEADKRRVSVTGGGGCTCRVEQRGERAPSAGLALLFGSLLLVRWRRRWSYLASVHRRLWLALAVLALVALSGGCKVNPLCLNCTDEDSGVHGNGRDEGGMTDNPDGALMHPKDSGTSGSRDAAGGGEKDGGGDAMSMTMQRDVGPGCVDTEVCNGQDDDCDGKIDEGVDPSTLGIDLQTDVKNCGVCGHNCALDHAFSRCSEGKCAIESCDPEYTDLDHSGDNGCEYRCTKIADTDIICDHRDDDCDKMIDDEVDFKNDSANCGSCGNSCEAPNAEGKGVCDQGVCKLAQHSCKAGFVDADGVFANGCEYQCTPRNDGAELCNNADDDCDRRIDEGVFDTDTRLGVPCGSATGNCTQGTQTCVGGAVVCQGGRGQVTEICNSKDDDCDGNTDEAFPQRGLPCGSDLGECTRGTQACVGGTLTCMGGVTAVAELCDGKDNDCDGRIDETGTDNVPPEHVGHTCSTSQGGTLVFDPPAPLGACRLGMTQCTSGHLVCMGEIGPKQELCDDIDQDCDGNTVYPNMGTDPMVGIPCGTNMGECKFGTTVCMNGMRVCDNSNGRLPVDEICNGKDDDCDGKYDETDAVSHLKPAGAGLPCSVDQNTGAVSTGSAASAQGACALGTSVCSGGFVACPDYKAPQPELCDLIDQDCDGNPLNGVESSDGRIGQACSNSVVLGACRVGTLYCNNGSLDCQGVVTPSPELCDGVDNDCDGDPLDDGADEPMVGMNCGTDTGDCNHGSLQCSGGALSCIGQIGPSAEVCDSADNDCDGLIDEDFQLQTNVNRCGACNHPCVVAHGTPKCTGGTCQVASCDPDYHDDASKAGADCDLGPCTIAGAEICNGVDDDCNGLVDDNLTAPAQFCNTNGACAGAVPVCQGVNKWQCSKLPAASELCNGIDDNCNRQTDEGFPIGQSCAASGVGACATKGTLGCSPDGMATICVDAQGNPVTTGTGKQEVCNGVDDDCDGTVDEPCGGSDMNCVSDAWVSLGNGIEIYQYEASRPDATAATTGSTTTRACSAANRLPWTNLTYLEARAACDAADPNGRLCTEAEWEQACMNDSMGSCTWAFPDYPGCNTWSTDQCNGVDRVATPVIQPSGKSGARNACYRGPSSDMSKQIFELSGNVKEYVLARDTGAIPVRGGANNNTQDGLRCDFDFPVWPNGSSFTNVGFRCCRGASALPTQCGTFQNTGLSLSSTALVEDTLNVAVPVGTITDVNVVNLKGKHTSMSQVYEFDLTGPDGTSIKLTNAGYCGTRDNWSYQFDTDTGMNLPPSTPTSNSIACGTDANTGAQLTFKPAESLAVFNGKTAGGNWKISVRDNTPGSANPTLNSWGLRICINPN